MSESFLCEDDTDPERCPRTVVLPSSLPVPTYQPNGPQSATERQHYVTGRMYVLQGQSDSTATYGSILSALLIQQNKKLKLTIKNKKSTNILQYALITIMVFSVHYAALCYKQDYIQCVAALVATKTQLSMNTLRQEHSRGSTIEEATTKYNFSRVLDDSLRFLYVLPIQLKQQSSKLALFKCTVV